MTFAEFVKWVSEHWEDVLVAINGFLAAVIAICMLIPGDQPEKFLQALVDFISKFSKKPKP